MAARLGFIWRGTSRFVCPSQFRWRGKTWMLAVPPEDAIQGVFRDVVLDDEYGLRSLAQAPRTVIDVGANVGIFSVWAGANFPRAVIHSYEPNPQIQSALMANVRQVQAQMFPEAIGQSDGTVSLEVQEGESVAGRCAIGQAGNTRLTALRTALERMGGSCDLLKLDCEGAEWDLLKDPASFDGVRSVRMEYHLWDKDNSVEALRDAFDAMGFQTIKLNRDPERGLAWFDRR